MNVSPYSPCSDELCYALQLITRANGNKPVDANLVWIEAYPGAKGGVQMTTSQNLVELQRAGWKLSGGGSVPDDASVFRNSVHIEPLK